MTPQQIITPDEVCHIARLARISLRDGDQETFACQLGDIIGYVNKLGDLDTEGVDPSFFEPVEAENLREDIPRKTIGREEALQNAPETQEGHFLLPPIINPSSSE